VAESKTKPEEPDQSSVRYLERLGRALKGTKQSLRISHINGGFGELRTLGYVMIEEEALALRVNATVTARSIVNAG
jgi:hypothetical protein